MSVDEKTSTGRWCSISTSHSTTSAQDHRYSTTSDGEKRSMMRRTLNTSSSPMKKSTGTPTSVRLGNRCTRSGRSGRKCPPGNLCTHCCWL